MASPRPPADLRADEAWGVLRIRNERGAVFQESWARLQLHSGALLLADPISRTAYDFGLDTFSFRFARGQQDFTVEEWVNGTQPEVDFCLDEDLDAAREAWAQRMAKRLGGTGKPRQAGPRL